MVKDYVFTGSFQDRLRASISFAWQIFKERVSAGAIVVNNDASMQFNYAHVLQQLSLLICYQEDEKVWVEINNTFDNNVKLLQPELFLVGKDKNQTYKLAIKTKCYQNAEDIRYIAPQIRINNFINHVYYDLMCLENCCDDNCDYGIILIMAEDSELVKPFKKNPKALKWSIAHNIKMTEVHIHAEVNGKEVEIDLEKEYAFKWENKEAFYFMELEGKPRQSEPKKKQAWDLFNTQPLFLRDTEIHKTSNEVGICIAAVSKTSKEYVWWDADYIIACNQPNGAPGSGFCEHPFSAIKAPYFDETRQEWCIQREKGRILRFRQATKAELFEWEQFKQFVPTCDELQKQADTM